MEIAGFKYQPINKKKDYIIYRRRCYDLMGWLLQMDPR